jgi:hypothetical protein
MTGTKIHAVEVVSVGDNAWSKYEFLVAAGSADKLVVSIPQAFTYNLSEPGADFCAEIFDGIAQCVSGKKFEPSTKGAIGSAQKLLSSWYGFQHLSDVSTGRAAAIDRTFLPIQEAERIGVFFSGGVDSTFTLSWLRARTKSKIVALSLIHSKDGLPDEAQLRVFEQTRKNLAKLDVELIYVATNVMVVNPRIHDLWAFATHGACHAAIGHLLSRNVDRWFLSSSHDYSALLPWGSHPLLDPLFSSEDVLISHFGTEFTRFQKISEIARAGFDLSSLSVCGKGPQSGAYFNCSTCQKCMRTMVALDLCEVKHQALSFDWAKYSGDSFSRIRLRGKNEVVFANELLRAAVALKRFDIADAVQNSIKGSRTSKVLYSAERAVRMRFPVILKAKPALKKMKSFLSS